MSIVPDPTNPAHYTSLQARCSSCAAPIECIDVSEHFTSNIGQAFQYLWRHRVKHEDPREDLRKAIWFLNREIERLSRG